MPQRQDKNRNAKDKADFTLMPWGAIKHIEPVMAFGAGKYEPIGYYTVPERRTAYIKALMRHMVDYFIGIAQGTAEPCDPETGLPHLHHAGACILIAIDDSCDDLPVMGEIPHVPTTRSRRDGEHPKSDVANISVEMASDFDPEP